MDNLDELHAAILADLDADASRLVLADALQSAGDPRGELIAIQCELARLGCDRTRVASWRLFERATQSRRSRLDRRCVGHRRPRADRGAAGT